MAGSELDDNALFNIHAKADADAAHSEGFAFLPIFLIFLFAVLAFWGGAYIGKEAGAFNPLVTDPSVIHQPAAEISECDLWEQQLARGQSAFQACAACHQATGLGVPGTFPPLVDASWAKAQPQIPIAIVLNGLQGPIEVKGATYGTVVPMAPLGGALSDEQIADILTFVRQNPEWGNRSGRVTADMVAEVRAMGRAEMWTAEDLVNAFGPLEETAYDSPCEGETADVGVRPVETTETKGSAPKVDEVQHLPPGNPEAITDAELPEQTPVVEPEAQEEEGQQQPAVVAGAMSEDEVQKLVTEGQTVYMQTCVACHQPTGQGLPPLYPPLHDNEWVSGNPERIAAMILKGMMGPIEVKGTAYNNPASIMTPQGPLLNDRQIAAVITYVRKNKEWGNDFSAMSPERVKEVRERHADMQGMWQASALLEAYPFKENEAEEEAAAEQQPAQPEEPETPVEEPAEDEAAAEEGQGPQVSAEELEKMKTDGATVYMQTCVACHQPTGLGLPPLYPPLHDNEWVSGDPERIVAMILKGMMGPIEVKGTTYNNPASIMTPQGQLLNDSQIASVVTYIRTKKDWGNDFGPVTEEMVKQVRERHADMQGMWQANKLLETYPFKEGE